MKKINPFFVIGTTGMLLTAVLHICFALVLGLPLVHQVFYVMYPAFLSFLVIGFAQIKQARQPA